MAKVIVVSSGKGGVGKTVTSINLASALNKLGKETILIDSNFTTPNIAINLGAPIIPITLNSVLQNKRTIFEALYQHHSGTKMILASLALKDLNGIKPELFTKSINELKKHSDFIIIDSAAGLGKEALFPFSVADEILVVTNPENAAATDALKTIQIAAKLNKKISIILNRKRNDKKELSTSDLTDLLEQKLLATIPEDSAVRESLYLRDAVICTHPRSKAAKAYLKLAKKIIKQQ